MAERYRLKDAPRYSVSRAGMGGRPSKYKSKYCKDLIALSKRGHSLTAFAGKVGVCRDTVRNWTKQFPAFEEAARVAAAASALIWEERLIKAADTGKGHVTAIIFGLKNRAADDWCDRAPADAPGSSKGPFTIELSAEMVSHLSNEELEKLEASLLAIAAGKVPNQPKALSTNAARYEKLIH